MDLEYLFYRIINGYYTITVDNIHYKIILPITDVKRDAHQVYLKTLDEYKYDTSSWISESAIKNLLNIYNIWNNNQEEILQKLINDLEKAKINLFQNYFNESSKSSLKDLIVNINNQINILYNKKHYFDYLTLEHYAQNIKNQYLIANMVHTLDNKKIFDYELFDDINSILIEKLLLEIHKNTIDTTSLKKLARHEMWRSLWNISKENVFESTVRNWTDEQKSLVNFSKVLDSIREHMEAPAEEIINDDDALDGWILYQNEKNNKEKKKKQISERFGLDKKRGDEVFLITKDKTEAKSIYGLNDANTNKDIKNMMKISNEKGKVDWTELPHVQRQIKDELRKQGKIK